MFPREHGAYGQLLFPLATALAVGRPTPAALTLCAAAVCAFIAHEPLLVLLGQRGSRAHRDQQARAWRWFAVFGAIGIALGAFGIAVASPGARLALAPPAALAAVLVATIASRRERTLFGEVVSALTLASLSFPVARAGGSSVFAATACALAFAAGFTAATVCVHGVIAATRRPPASAARARGFATSVGVWSALALSVRLGAVSVAAPLAALPMCLAGCVLVAWPPSARRLLVVGWTLAGTSALEGLLLVAVLG